MDDRTTAVKAFFDARAAQWDSSCKHDPGKIAALVTLAQVREGTKVLDIACGTGVLVPELLSRKPAEIVGIDLSDEMVRIARDKHQRACTRFYAMDILDMSESGFDVALIYSAYPHFPDKERLARHVWELLAPNGRFLVAHSDGRDVINRRHDSVQVQAVSTTLHSAQEEADIWGKHFQIDLLGDNSDIYFFSGVKR